MMQNKKLKAMVADKVADVLEMNLVKRANAVSCSIWYEPKAPEALSRYRKGKKG